MLQMLNKNVKMSFVGQVSSIRDNDSALLQEMEIAYVTVSHKSCIHINTYSIIV